MKLLGDYIKSRRGVLLFFALAAALLGVTRFSMKRKMEREDGEK